MVIMTRRLKKMKDVKQAIVLVDNYRRPSRKRNTAGRYRVGAKTEKEATHLVQKAIGFGSVQFYCWDTTSDKTAEYKQVIKEVPADTDYIYEEPRHACSPIKEEDYEREG